jgi:hypothetical protein
MFVASAGDLNGDGYPDVLIGTFFGTASVFASYGGTSGISSITTLFPKVAGQWSGSGDSYPSMQ